MAVPHPRPTAQVVHTGPHRIRLRLDRDHRRPEQLSQLRHALRGQPGVRDVEVNETTGSVLIHHAPGAVSAHGLAAVLGDLGVVIQGLAGDEAGKSETARGVESALGDLNRRVATATGGKADLKIIVPGAFLAWGLWRLAADVGSFFTAVPGYVLLYYAFDTYTKLHHMPASVSTGARDTSTEGASAEDSGAG
jgi:hypothetical protein